jgi:hypothetical protein
MISSKMAIWGRPYMTNILIIRVLMCSTFIAGSGVILQGCIFDPGANTLVANQEPARKNTPTVKRVAAKSNETTFARSDRSSNSGSSSGMGSGSSSGSSGSDSGGGDSGGGDTGWNSDRRLKTNVHRLGTSPAGIPIYAFRYVWGGPLFIGAMAQDLLLIRPDAVIQTASGYYRVDYEKLDIDMISVAEGISLATAGAGATAVALAVDAASKRQRKPPAVFSSQRAVQPAM